MKRFEQTSVKKNVLYKNYLYFIRTQVHEPLCDIFILTLSDVGRLLLFLITMVRCLS